MELQQIEYFRIIAKTENISKAAEMLYVAQPSLSQMLKRLEDELGVQLFDRIGKKIVLNDGGRIFLKYCDDITGSLQNARLELSEAGENKVLDVNIAVESASLLVPDLIEKMRCQAPAIMPHVFQSHYSDWDLKIWSDFHAADYPQTDLLMHEPIGIVMAEHHPLHDSAEITMSALLKYDFISLSPSNNLYSTIDHFCTVNGFRQKISMFVDSPYMLRDLVKMNLGIAFAPQYTWSRFYGNGTVYRPVADMPMSRSVYLSLNSNRFAVDAVRKCRDITAEYFAEYSRKFQ